MRYAKLRTARSSSSYTSKTALQIGHIEKALHPLGWVQQLQRTSRPPEGRIARYQLAKTGAVDVRSLREVQQDLPAPPGYQTRDGIAHRVGPFAESNAAGNIDYGYVVDLAVIQIQTHEISFSLGFCPVYSPFYTGTPAILAMASALVSLVTPGLSR